MITKKQQLIKNPKEYINDDSILDCYYSEKLNNFCLLFNGKIFTFKTWNGFVNKRNYLIEKYNLININP